MATVFLAGGAGYIGSHTAVELLNAGYDVVVRTTTRTVRLRHLKELKR